MACVFWIQYLLSMHYSHLLAVWHFLFLKPHINSEYDEMTKMMRVTEFGTITPLTDI